MEQFDLVVIGSGPGGYVGAIRAAQLGMKTAVIEKDKTFGGTCLNVGCIPSKALLDSSEHYDLAKHSFASHGIRIKDIELDLPAMMGRKDKVVKELTSGIAFLFKKNKITTFAGTGSIEAPGQVSVKATDGSTQTIQAKNIMIATGSIPASIPTIPYDGKRILSSTEALCLSEVPKHLIVIGGGVIGLELGSVWLRLGAKVTVVEYNDRVGGVLDKQVGENLKKILEKQGFNFQLNAKVSGAKVAGSSVTVTMDGKNGEQLPSLNGDYVLLAIGRRPFTENLGLEKVGIMKDQRGCIVIDDHFRTNVPGIYAIGDVVKGPMLAHKAEEEGVACAEILAGKAGHVNYDTVPGVIYTWPEVATVGISEEQAKERGIDYKAGSFPFVANGRAKAMASTDGFVKIISDKRTDRVLGVHIIGPRASDIICEAVVAMEFGASTEDIARSFHAHPTLAEVIREAALAVDKQQRQM